MYLTTHKVIWRLGGVVTQRPKAACGSLSSPCLAERGERSEPRASNTMAKPFCRQILEYLTITDKLYMAPWRSGYAEVCKTFYTGSIPVGASKRKYPSTSRVFSFGAVYCVLNRKPVREGGTEVRASLLVLTEYRTKEASIESRYSGRLPSVIKRPPRAKARRARSCRVLCA